jgi:hypothetical protein
LNIDAGYHVGNDGYLYFETRDGSSNYTFRKVRLSGSYSNTTIRGASAYHSRGVSGYHFSGDALTTIYDVSRSTSWNIGYNVADFEFIGMDGTSAILILQTSTSGGIYVVELVAGGTVNKTLINSLLGYAMGSTSYGFSARGYGPTLGCSEGIAPESGAPIFEVFNFYNGSTTSRAYLINGNRKGVE